jgi:hypothetical protein
VVWEREPLKLNANDVICGAHAKGPDRKEERREQAIAWLRATLAAGPLAAHAVIDRARAAGFGRDLIWEVKKAAGVRSQKQLTENGPWFWSLEPAGGGAGAGPARAAATPGVSSPSDSSVSSASDSSPFFNTLHNTSISFRILPSKPMESSEAYDGSEAYGSSGAVRNEGEAT